VIRAGCVSQKKGADQQRHDATRQAYREASEGKKGLLRELHTQWISIITIFCGRCAVACRTDGRFACFVHGAAADLRAYGRHRRTAGTAATPVLTTAAAILDDARPKLPKLPRTWRKRPPFPQLTAARLA